jgi:hypothetical protein
MHKSSAALYLEKGNVYDFKSRSFAAIPEKHSNPYSLDKTWVPEDAQPNHRY